MVIEVRFLVSCVITTGNNTIEAVAKAKLESELNEILQEHLNMNVQVLVERVGD